MGWEGDNKDNEFIKKWKALLQTGYNCDGKEKK